MNYRQKLNIFIAAFIMTLSILFVTTWLTNGLGWTHFDLSILLQAIEITKGFLSYLTGGI